MLTHFSISQQGERHIEKEEPCQDFSSSTRVHLDRLNCDLVLAAIADGVGSCMFSQYGAEMAVMSFISCMIHNLNKNSFELSDESIRNLLEHAFRYALSQVATKAKEMELPFIEFDSTLTGVLFDGSNLWFGHVGDDGIVVLYTDGTYEMITKRHEGKEQGELFPLCHEEKWQFGRTSKEVASLVLMTDGVLNYCVDSEAMGNRIYFPFLEPALTTTLETDEQAEKQKEEWDAYLLESSGNINSFRRAVTDDISFVLIENSEAVSGLPEIYFDREKWDTDTKRRREELDEALYGDYRRFKEKQQMQSRQEITNPYTDTVTVVDGYQSPLVGGESSAYLHQDETLVHKLPGAKRASYKLPKTRANPLMQGTVIHNPPQSQFSTPILEVFETAYSAGREIGESFSQIMEMRKAQPTESDIQKTTLKSTQKNEKQK